MKIAYLCSADTLPGNPKRREDAFEHDQMMAALKAPFMDLGMRIEAVQWDLDGLDWTSFAAVLIGTVWDYMDKEQQFLKVLMSIEAKTQLYNSSQMVEWNIKKTYLKTLEERGIKIIPTIWAKKLDQQTLTEAFKKFSCEKIVAKRQVGAGAAGQYLVTKNNTLPLITEAMMLQPFMPQIVEEGEYSFIYVNSEFSHALLKTASKGDYRIQSLYGGTESVVTPSKRERSMAKAVLNALDEKPLYARVDMIRGKNNELNLMELELIEPFLYPLQGPNLGYLLAKSIHQRLTQT